MSGYPETAEGVAFALMREIVRQEDRAPASATGACERKRWSFTPIAYGPLSAAIRSCGARCCTDAARTPTAPLGNRVRFFFIECDRGHMYPRNLMINVPANRGFARPGWEGSLGPWCAVEVLSVDWMRALAEAFAVHFPHFVHEPYFEDTFAHQVEERHAQESLAVTQTVLRQRPELLRETLRDAEMMAEALDGVWTNLDRVVQAAERRLRRGLH